ncbi:MAG: hypothetical protein LQ346_002769 [Caloplaca aetnensis]|nr:MAG: hypothetical protein LQ346_002769 [Caloplaca aetnensis]
MSPADDDGGPLYYQRIAEELHSHSQTINTSTNLISAFFFLVLAYQLVYWLDYPVAPMSELIWNSAIQVTPSRILSALESALLPTPTQNAGDDAQTPRSITHAQKSDTMRRVLGLDGTGILSKLQSAKSLPAANTLLRATSKGTPPGLGNWDNSCYQNSVIQGLTSLPSFADFLRQSDISRPSRSTRAALRGIIDQLKDQSNLGAMFWTPSELKSMSSWQQQDAQEYFSKLMDEVEKDTAQDGRQQAIHCGLAAIRNLSPDPSSSLATGVEMADAKATTTSNKRSPLSKLPDELQTIVARNPLEGLLAQRVGCLKCGFVEGLSLIPFNCLTLPLGKHWLYDIRTCLDEYTALEPISGVECAKCTLLQAKTQLEKLRNQFSEEPARQLQASAPLVTDALRNSVEDRLRAVDEALENKDFSDNTILKKCQIPHKSKVSSTKTRQAVIARAPKSFAIHINRSVFNEMTGMLSKNYADVRFPLRFSLASWCLGGRLRRDEKGEENEQWSTSPSESMLSQEVNEDDIAGSTTYELRAALTHYGRHENGHYICYRRHRTDAKLDENAPESTDTSWWRFSDEDVSAVSEENVLAQGGVFMLFYERTDDPSPTSVHSNPTIVHSSTEAANLAPESQTCDAIMADTKPSNISTVLLAADETYTEGQGRAHSGILSRPGAAPEPATSEPTSSTSQPPSSPLDTVLHPPLLPSSNTVSSTSKTNDFPSSSSDIDPTPSSPLEPSKQPAKCPSFSHSMRTATPRNGRGQKGMGQVSSMVTAS